MCGKPVIASRSIPVMLDNPDDRLSIAVDENNIETLKLALRRMYVTKKEYNSEIIMQYAQENFSEVAIAQRLTEIFRGAGMKEQERV